MAYTPFQDGTQVFGIPDSPVSINSDAFIAEDISFNQPATVTVIRDPNGIPIGQVIAPDVITGTCKLQRASTSVEAPAVTDTFDLRGQTWVLSEVGETYTQGAYAYVNCSFRMVING